MDEDSTNRHDYSEDDDNDDDDDDDNDDHNLNYPDVNFNDGVQGPNWDLLAKIRNETNGIYKMYGSYEGK